MTAALILALLVGATPAPAPADETLDAPAAGWRNDADAKTTFLQPVHYPASSVSTEAAAAADLIAGHLKASAKSPATLVVNGVSMPLQVGEGGQFARPYSFTAGSNSVEVRGDDGARVRRQFFRSAAGGKQARMRVVLSWDSDSTDLDLHVVGPTGEHTYYGDRVSPSGGALDVDVTTGYGPEIFAHPAPPPGLYHVFVNYYGSGETTEDVTIVQAAVITGEGTPQEKQQVFRVPLRKPGELMLVHSFVYP